MPQLKTMPRVLISEGDLAPFGVAWAREKNLSRTPPNSSMELGGLLDRRVAEAISHMLGEIPIIVPTATALMPAQANAVECGPCRIIGGVRPQNFDVAYRPDGVRIAFDSKTLNDAKSVQKNYQNMINDLGTEATTVHVRFPSALVAFLVAVPKPCLRSPQKEALTGTLERMSPRLSPLDSAHRAEAISLIVWNPDNGAIDAEWPPTASPLRIERFSELVERAYVERFKGLPPHTD
jgi:hypothetical protein